MNSPRKASSEPPTLLELERAWLVKEGLASPAPGGEYVLTDDGLKFMVWAIYQRLGRPGMPAEALEGKVTT